jgi:CTP synthase
MCVFEALESAAHKHSVDLEIKWINAEKVTKAQLKSVDGIVVPGGFGERGIEGKIFAAGYAIDNKVPYLGLCLGMQALVVAVARKSGLKDANSIEVDPQTPDPVIYIMEGQENLWGTGGTMRLGDYDCVLEKGSKAQKLYKSKIITERHRHRYEVNNEYRSVLEKNGLKLVGLSPDGNLVELVEHKNNPFMMASQYHPEFKSRPNRPHPMFDGFIASLKK